MYERKKEILFVVGLKIKMQKFSFQRRIFNIKEKGKKKNLNRSCWSESCLYGGNLIFFPNLVYICHREILFS